MKSLPEKMRPFRILSESLHAAKCMLGPAFHKVPLRSHAFHTKPKGHVFQTHGAIFVPAHSIWRQMNLPCFFISWTYVDTIIWHQLNRAKCNFLSKTQKQIFVFRCLPLNRNLVHHAQKKSHDANCRSELAFLANFRSPPDFSCRRTWVDVKL